MPDNERVAETSYDLVPYESRPYPQTTPDRLATVATLFGANPAPAGNCTVLELGCAGGGNLIAMAVEYPSSQFLGLDASARQIDDGLATIGALGLTNIVLRQADILKPIDIGPVDYVVCHGVYSWVPPEVRERILGVCSERLAPQGVAYVSYNTFPGWHLRGMVRDMMRYHAERFDDPATRVQQAAALLDFLAGSVRSKDGPYGRLLKQELDLLRGLSGSYLFHEHLEEVNEPVYFHRFAESAAEHGLQYLGEAEVSSMAAYRFPDAVRNTLRRLSSDRIRSEQYLDFLRNRTFRQTLLCRANVRLDATIRPERLATMQVAGAILRAEPDSADPDAAVFRGRGGEQLTTHDPALSRMLERLAELWPSAVPYASLLKHARAEGHPDAATLGNQLLRLYLTSDLIELHVDPPAFVRALSDRPVASPLARLQARSGDVVTSLRHERVTLSVVDRFVVALADGSRDRSAIAEAIEQAIRAGRLLPADGDGPIEDANAVARVSADASLRTLARTALLSA
jgi:methyltransferase-like protein/trans-aconitate methyltransferase